MGLVYIVGARKKFMRSHECRVRVFHHRWHQVDRSGSKPLREVLRWQYLPSRNFGGHCRYAGTWRKLARLKHWWLELRENCEPFLQESEMILHDATGWQRIDTSMLPVHLQEPIHSPSTIPMVLDTISVCRSGESCCADDNTSYMMHFSSLTKRTNFGAAASHCNILLSTADSRYEMTISIPSGPR